MSDSSLPKAPRQLPDVAPGVVVAQHQPGALPEVGEAQAGRVGKVVAHAEEEEEHRAARLRRIRTPPR